MKNVKSPVLRFLWRTGLWLYPILFIIIFCCFKLLLRAEFSANLCVISALLAAVPILYFNTEAQRKTALKDDTEKPQAQYPEIPAELQRRLPQSGDIVFGELDNTYVCTNLHTDFHSIIIGGSGSGKSSTQIIGNLLLNPDTSVFAVDIKGELSQKATKIGDERIHIFNPQDHSSWGFNPLYLLEEDSSEQVIFETMQTITYSLIPKPADIRDPFWIDSARSMLIAFLIHLYKDGNTTLVEIIDEILSRPAKEIINEILDNSEGRSNERKLINQFADLAANTQGNDTTLGGIVVQMSNALTVFSTDEDIRYAFGSNSRKISPMILNEGKSIYLVLKDERLDSYSTILQLIINLTLGELMKREENAINPVWVVIDELPRLLSTGRLEKLLTSIKVCRSKRVRLTLVTQSLEALRTAYSENEVIDLLSNCNYKVVLDASSSKTQKMVCEMAGTYKERKLSASHSNKNSRSTTTSYEEKRILKESDLITLAQTGDTVLLTPYGYLRVHKTPYYSDGYFKLLAEKVKRYNDNVLQLQHKLAEKMFLN